uniref:Uncharacterized protein n=1 Tax=Anguilla anguilla TaxID=7936 RepID=A0A0E9W4K8_ANGAN
MQETTDNLNMTLSITIDNRTTDSLKTRSNQSNKNRMFKDEHFNSYFVFCGSPHTR